MPRHLRVRPLALITLVTQLAWLGGGPVAAALDLAPPFALETSETLPKNVRNPRFIDIFANVTTKFGDDGVGEGLGAPLNKLVHWSDVLATEAKLEHSSKAALLNGVLKANGMDETGSPGSTVGQVNTFADVKVAALAWGITDRITVAGVLPVIKVNVSASTGFTPGADYGRFVSALSKDQSPFTAQEATGQLNDAVNRKLLALGYQPIPANETISGIGDAQLIGKYRLYNDGVNGVALKGTLVFPTGTPPDPDKALDIPLGTGRFGAGLAAIYDRELAQGRWLGLRWNSYASYTAFLPHHIDKRIPTSVDDPLSDYKEDMYERTRSQVLLGTGLEHFFPTTGILLSGGYAYQFMTRADYQPGTAVGQDRYYLLGDQEPLEDLHSLVASAGFSTIDWFKRKKFVYPMQVNFSYSHPIAGRNVPNGDLMTGELVVFF
jgi:hypothetical protein